MSEPEIQSVLAIHEELKKSYTLEFDLDYSCDLKPFASFEYDQILDSGPFLKITNPRKFFYLGFFQLGYHITPGRYPYGNCTEFQTWGMLELEKDYGHILIKPESMLDKIHEMIHPIELDFEDDLEFSKQFYVLAEDKTKADLYLTPSFRNQVKTITTTDFIIEILGNKLIMGNKKRICLDSAVEFVQFLDRFSGKY